MMRRSKDGAYAAAWNACVSGQAHLNSSDKGNGVIRI